jgi:hypothetical protein
MSEYVDQLMAAFAKIGHTLDTVMFTGWSPGRFEEFSRCCSYPIFTRSLYEGIPFCSHCFKDLGPDDLRYEWVPPHAHEHAQAVCPWPQDPETHR